MLKEKQRFANGYEEKGKKKNESVNEGKKRYYQKDGIGKSKYTISYHDGKKKHKDGSDFFDIQIFRNKKDLAKFVNSLHKGGYVYGFGESVNEILVIVDKFDKRKQDYGKVYYQDGGKRPGDGDIEKAKKEFDKLSKKHKGLTLISVGRNSKMYDVMDESVNEASIKGRNNRTGEAFGMVIGSDKKNREGDFEVTIRITYSARIHAYTFVFDKSSNLTAIKDYGSTLNGKFPDMSGSSVKSVRPNPRETITQIAKITSPAFAKKIHQHVKKVNESVNEASKLAMG